MSGRRRDSLQNEVSRLTRPELSVSDARRIALAAQGADLARPRRASIAHLRRLVHRLGLLQIDSVNVLVPAHYMVPFSRLGPYDIKSLHDLVYRRREFTEQWAREASIVPIDTWPLLRYRMQDHDRRARATAAYLVANAAYADRVLRTVRARGPLVASDIPEPDATRRPRRGFWDWSRAKTTLEAHFARGTLAVADRRGTTQARVYDLSTRVLPAEVRRHRIDRVAAQRELLLRAARAHGIGTAGDLADYHRLPIRDARACLDELAASGALEIVRVEGWKEPAYLHPQAERPRNIAACMLLSPFDPIVWYRPRLARLFDFDYVLEIWVPRARRRWGYYVLSFLLGERLVARVDLKADRERRRLLVLAAYREPHAAADEVAPALAGELRTLANWLQLDDVVVGRRGNLALGLGRAVRLTPGA